MNAPLSRYLTRFSAQPTMEAIALAPEAPQAEPMTTLALAELDARLETARDEASAAAEAAHAQRLAALASGHETALAEAVAAARAERAMGEAEALLAHVDCAFAALRENLADGIAKVLRPIVADAFRERTTAALGEAVACLLADPAHPVIALHAPESLAAAIRARGTPAGVDLVVTDVAEATVTANSTRIETRLAAALAGLSATEQ